MKVKSFFMKIGKQEAGLLVSKLEQCAHEFDFDWRLYARLCITAGMKNKFREVSHKVEEQYSFPFADRSFSALLAAVQ